MDKLEFLDAGEPAIEAVQPETVAQPETAEPAGEAKPRDEHGRFARQEAAEPPVQAQPEPVEQPQQPAAPEPVMVPIAALHETRDKVRDLEARLAQLQPQPQRQQPVEVPDPELDPVGFAQFQDSQRYSDRLFFSERLAVIQNGQDTFEKAKAWGIARCNADPYFNAQVRQSQDPYSIVMAEYQRDQIATQVNMTDFEKFKAWEAAQGQLAQTQQPAAQAAVPQPAALPRSIATAPSAGGVQTIAVGPGVAFDDTIK